MTSACCMGHTVTHCCPSLKDAINIKVIFDIFDDSHTYWHNNRAFLFLVILFVATKIGNYPTVHQQENGRTNFGTSVFIHSYLKTTKE